MRLLLIGLVRLYQLLVAPHLRPSCRFLPSCSAYMIESLREHGTFRGLALGVRRLLRCHPGCPGGFDPAPLRKTLSDSRREGWEEPGAIPARPGASPPPP